MANAPLNELVFQYLERVEAGECGEAVLEELTNGNSEQGEALLRSVAFLRETHLHPVPSVERIPETIGPFRIVRRLGVGGMGVVYEALQSHPNRRVALKMVRPDQLHFDGARERFEREIDSAARLSHPGIAAILETGEHGGVPWFTQELVVGIPLGELLLALPVHSLESTTASDVRALASELLREAGQETPEEEWNAEFYSGSWIDMALRIVALIADALGHAHARGVLHRDVKPSNVILTPAGRAVLVDFGLASIQGTSRLTRTGAQIGSLHYMPPEQIEGRSSDLDQRSDIYSLGVTLYELLTLRAPYSSQSIERLHRLIARGEATDVRRLNPSVPRDAATVCAKAMDASRERRYSDAVALGADVSAVIERRPIRARPAGPLLRLVRWTQRNPARAVSVVAAFLLVVVGPIVFGLQASMASSEQKRINDDLVEALERSQTNLEGAMDAIERVMRRTAENGLDRVPGMLELRVTVADEALEIFERLEASQPDEELEFLHARLLVTKGLALSDLGRNADAEATLASAAASIEARARSHPDDERWTLQLARLCSIRGRNLGATGRYEESIEHHRRALDIHRGMAERYAESVRFEREYGAAATNLAHALRSAGRPARDYVGLLDRALESTESATLSEPADIDSLTTRFEALRGSANRAIELERFEDAKRDLLASVDAMRLVLEQEPRSRAGRRNLSISLRKLGWLSMVALQEPGRAVECLDEALELIEEVAAENPTTEEYQNDRLAVLQTLAGARRKQGDLRGAHDAGVMVSRGFTELAERSPGNRLHRVNAAKSWINVANYVLGDLERGETRIDLALRYCGTAEALLDELDGVAAGALEARDTRVQLHFQRGSAVYWMGDSDALYREIEALQRMLSDRPIERFQIAFLWMRMSELSDSDDDRGEACTWLELAIDSGFSNLEMLEKSGMIESLDTDRARALGGTLRERIGVE